MPTPWSDPGHATPADLAACRATLRQGSRTFLAASLFLPGTVAGPACSLYAFCRFADDLVDQAGGGLDALDILGDRLTRIYAGRPDPTPVDRALADVVRIHAIPRTLLDALLEGFAWDAGARRYANLTELRDYAARVAGTVGAMMTLLMGVRDPAALARACDLGVAMQLSNIARDVGEDARNGRLYLPLDWLAEAGIDAEAFMARPVFSPALAAVVERVLNEADRLYRRSEEGIARLPAGCRPGIFAARRLYAAIGDQVRRNGYDSVSTRAVVPGSRKLTLLARSFMAAAGVRVADPQDPLAETAFLVDAVDALPLAQELQPPAWWDLRGRLHWTLDMFIRLQTREARPDLSAASERT